MTDTDRETPLGGLAGTIDALFTALERSRAAARRAEYEGEARPPDPPGEGLAGPSEPTPDGEVVGIADLAPDLAPVGIADLAPGVAPIDVADLAPDDGPMEMADLAPGEAPVEGGDLVAGPAAMDVADLAPDDAPMEMADLAPDDGPVEVGDLAPDPGLMDVDDLAPDGPPVDVADLAPDDGPMDMADLAPDDGPVEVGDLAPDPGLMDMADLAPDDAPMEIADLAPEDGSGADAWGVDEIEIGGLAPEGEPIGGEAPAGEEEPARIEGFEPTSEPFGIGALEAIPEVGIEELAPDPEPVEAAPGRDEARPDAGVDSPAEALSDAVERYLASGGARRDELSRKIRGIAGALEEQGDLRPVSDAVERLIIAGHRHEQAPPVSLARLLATPGVIDLLTGRLGSVRDEERRAQLVEVGGALGERMAPGVGDALSSTDSRSARRAYMDALVAMGDEASGVVSDMLRDARWYVVRNAVLILGEIGGRATLDHLASALSHDDPRVRREALLALARIGGVTARTMVPKHLGDPDPQVRAAAALATGELKVERGQRLLVSRLDVEKVEAVQVALIRALGRFGDPASVAALEKRAAGGFFSRRPTEVRVAAYRALAAIGGSRARRLLQDALDDRDEAVRSAVRAALSD